MANGLLHRPGIIVPENPTVNDHDARPCLMTDTQENMSPEAPYFINPFSASQTYRWKDGLRQYTSIEGHSISRCIWTHDGNDWGTTCTKSPSQAEWYPLPQ
jgi:hypothetical protein